ncbi:MAG: hypothetical protein ACM3Z4_01460 [Hyphomicrobiales bacterium]
MADATDYRKFYNLEEYLLGEVGPRFRTSGIIRPIDMFMIFIWKANRAKTKYKDNLKKRADGNFSDAVTKIAAALSATKDRKERLAILMRDWGFRLPMASAILTALYPIDFTVYDTRVCKMLGLDYRPWLPFSENLWIEYERYREAVRTNTPPGLTLRNRDKYL